MLTCDDYRLPRSLKSALEAWSKAPEGSRLVAGATDTLPWARQGRAGDIVGDVHVPLLVDVTEVSALDSYRLQDDGRIRLGANLVFQQFLEDENLARYLPHMPPCALWFADDQIRRQATLGPGPARDQMGQVRIDCVFIARVCSLAAAGGFIQGLELTVEL